MQIKGILISAEPDKFYALNDVFNLSKWTVKIKRNFLLFPIITEHRVKTDYSVNLENYINKKVKLELE
jgi:hypothetical protein